MKLKTLRNSIMTITVASILATNTAFVHADLGDTTLKYNMNSDDVKVLQNELSNLGYFETDDEFSTYYGKTTIEAVQALQSDLGLDISGIYESNTHKKLLDLKEKKFNTYKLSYTQDLKLEDENNEVNKLQLALKELGFLDIDECTNYFGSITEKAIISFQRAVGISADGIAGSRTMQMINKALAGEDIFIELANRGGERNSLAENIISTGKRYLGTPYRSGQSGPGGFDCSGFTQYVYKKNGINVSRSSSSQAQDGTWVGKSDLQPGDLLIFVNTYKSGPSHTGIYIGNDKFIHSSSVRSGGVKISSLNENYYKKHFSNGRRVY